VTGAQVAGCDLVRIGRNLAAHPHARGAACVEAASRGRVGGAWHVSLEDVLVADALLADAGDDVEQGLGVGVARVVEQLRLGCELHHVSKVHDHDRIGDVLDDRQVVADEDVGQAEAALQLHEQVDDLRLDGDVERRDGLVADDDLRLEDDGPGDADTLALTTRELMGIAGAIGQVEPHLAHDLVDACVTL